MICMLIKLYDPNCLDDLMLALTAHDVHDAVVLDGTAVAPVLTQEMPLFAGFRVDLGEPRGAMKVILAVVKSEDAARTIRNELRDAGIDLNDHTIAKVFLMPIEELT